MALAALIGAYQEDDAGGLYALQPLAGRTLLEYQARCAAAVGCAPIVVLVEMVPAMLAAALERLRAEGIAVVAVSDSQEAAARFEPHTRVLQIADGVAPAMPLVDRIAAQNQPAVLTVRDDDNHDGFERIDKEHRWAGLALIDGQTLATTAAMLGDWDLLSTLLRRTIQAGALHVPAGDELTPYHAQTGGGPQEFDRSLLTASRRTRPDWVARFLLPPVEEFATERLMPTRVQPPWLVTAALLLTVVAAVAISRGYLWTAVGLLLAGMPLDIVGERLGHLRLQPLQAQSLTVRLLRPASGLALLALGWFNTNHGGTWGALVTAVAAVAFAEALRKERSGRDLPFGHWLFDRRPAIVVAALGAIGGMWNLVLILLAVYAAASFFLVQHWVHDTRRG